MNNCVLRIKSNLEGCTYVDVAGDFDYRKSTTGYKLCASTLPYLLFCQI